MWSVDSIELCKFHSGTPRAFWVDYDAEACITGAQGDARSSRAPASSAALPLAPLSYRLQPTDPMYRSVIHRRLLAESKLQATLDYASTTSASIGVRGRFRRRPSCEDQLLAEQEEEQCLFLKLVGQLQRIKSGGFMGEQSVMRNRGRWVVWWTCWYAVVFFQ
jgi:hypothetical protein